MSTARINPRRVSKSAGRAGWSRYTDREIAKQDKAFRDAKKLSASK